jgi:serine/threonine-protein kinase RsbW
MQDRIYRKRATLKDLVDIRSWVEEAALSCGMDRQGADDIVLAMDEAVTNVLIHGYEKRPGFIEIEIVRQGDEVIFYLRDRARPFDPTQVDAPDLSLALHERPFGGMGIFFINKLVDRVEYRQVPEGGNELKLVMKKAIHRIQLAEP